MPDNIKKFYSELKEKLTAEHLKKITVDIINSYKNKNYKHLKKYLSILKINPETNSNKLFALLIKHYHPDKLSLILKQAEEIYKSRNLDNLKKFHDKFFFNIESAASSPEIDIKFEDIYKFDEEDFGYTEKNIFENDNLGETDLEFDEESDRFIDAVNKLFFGGLDDHITKSDLGKIDGELDLSDYDISDLSGIENCIYLEELNLSNNNIDKIRKLSALKELRALYISNNSIENIECLENLKKLKELDISFNNVTDITVLNNLEKLEYVNIIGNPINDYSVINSLTKRGVIVIFEHTNLLF